MEAPTDDTILVVEDDDAVRAFLSQSLRLAGFAVLEARNGLEAYRVVEAHQTPLALIVTDVVMAGISGLQLLQRLRRWYPGIPALVVSGHEAPAAQVAELDGTTTRFLAKPFNGDELVRVVEELLARPHGSA